MRNALHQVQSSLGTHLSRWAAKVSRRRESRRRSSSANIVCVERVEDRCLLAGVVGVSISNSGNITLTGDAEANDIEITVFDGTRGRIRGLNGTLLDSGDLIGNSYLFDLEELLTEVGPFQALRGNLTVNLGAGDDSLEILGTSGPLEPFVIEGRLEVGLGAGADTFRQSVSYVGGRARIRGGSGDGGDHIEIEETFMFGDTQINTGASGDALDQIVIDDSFIVSAELRGSGGATEVSVRDTTSVELEIFTGGSDDQIFVSDAIVLGDLRIDTGSASNSAPGDYVGLGDSVVVGDLRINGRQGRQTIEFLSFAPGGDFEVGGNTLISTAGGRDVVRVNNDELVRFNGNVRVRTGGGDDEVQVEDSAEFLGNLNVSMGGGSDSLEIWPMVMVSGNGVLNGGGGLDSLNASHEFAMWLSGLPNVTSFETIA